MPIPSKLLEPQKINSEFAKEKKKLKNAKCNWYYDRNAKDIESLAEDDEVQLKPHELGKREWGKGKIVKSRVGVNSFLSIPIQFQFGAKCELVNSKSIQFI